MNDMLSWLMVGHMVGDYLFQNHWMAANKRTRYSALTVHSAVYAIAVWISSLAVLPPKGLNPLCVLLVFAAHALIDRRSITLWWCRHVTRSDSDWLVIVTDQAMHVVILALTCLLERSI